MLSMRILSLLVALSLTSTALAEVDPFLTPAQLAALGVEPLPSIAPTPSAPPKAAAPLAPANPEENIFLPHADEDPDSWLPMSEYGDWGFTSWEGNVEFGLNGSRGNSDTFNLRFGVGANRKTDASETTLDLDYRKDSQNNMETANRLFFEGRKEWFFGDSPWSVFGHGTFEYDEFRAFDSRVALDSGFGYAFFDNDVTKFGGRFGAGVSREIGGPDDRIVPEAAFGLDFEHQLTKRQKITATADYFPDWGDFMDYRLNTKFYWSIVLDEASHLTLKIGVDDRYDSTPFGAKHNDLDYSTVLIWDF